MIYADLRNYDYYTFSGKDTYGQPKLSEDVQGAVKMAIYTVSQNLQQNILYKDCSYTGLTQDASINDTYVISYEGKKLKVLYVQPKGRFKQVFLAGM